MVAFSIKSVISICLICLPIATADLSCSIKRDLFQDGFHRTLCTNVTIQGLTTSQCVLTLMETLPSGLYVDTFQLAMSESFGGPKVCTKEPIDVEKPEHRSPSHRINIFSPVVTRYSFQSMNLCVPVHIRYHKPDDFGRATVIIPNPTLLSSCAGESQALTGPCSDNCEAECRWYSLPCTYETDEIVLTVPVGVPSHLWLVTIVTLATIIAGVIILLRAMLSKARTFNKVD